MDAATLYMLVVYAGHLCLPAPRKPDGPMMIAPLKQPRRCVRMPQNLN